MPHRRPDFSNLWRPCENLSQIVKILNDMNRGFDYLEWDPRLPETSQKNLVIYPEFPCEKGKLYP